AAGFAGVEYLFPYEFDKAQLREQLEAHGLTQVLHNLPAGNWAKGERGIAILPDRASEFRDGVFRAIDYAKALDCEQLTCLVRTMQEYLPEIAHIQLADNPGRNEPGTGEINYPFLFRHLDAIGYRGWIGCEYKPRTTTLEGLSWHAAQTFETSGNADMIDIGSN